MKIRVCKFIAIEEYDEGYFFLDMEMPFVFVGMGIFFKQGADPEEIESVSWHPGHQIMYAELASYTYDNSDFDEDLDKESQWLHETEGWTRFSIGLSLPPSYYALDRALPVCAKNRWHWPKKVES